jgi:hypothetical protein
MGRHEFTRKTARNMLAIFQRPFWKSMFNKIDDVTLYDRYDLVLRHAPKIISIAIIVNVLDDIQRSSVHLPLVKIQFIIHIYILI